MVLDLVHDALVLQGVAVVREVDALRLVRENLQFAARVVVALLEGLEGRGGLAFEAEGGADFRPVNFEGGASLGWRDGLAQVDCGSERREGRANDILRQPWWWIIRKASQWCGYCVRTRLS